MIDGPEGPSDLGELTIATDGTGRTWLLGRAPNFFSEEHELLAYFQDDAGNWSSPIDTTEEDEYSVHGYARHTTLTDGRLLITWRENHTID